MANRKGLAEPNNHMSDSQTHLSWVTGVRGEHIKSSFNNKQQAGAELGQAQAKFELLKEFKLLL